MVDINKYLETLANNKSKTFNIKNQSVSEKSKAAANRIGNKQKKSHKKENSSQPIPSTSSFVDEIESDGGKQNKLRKKENSSQPIPSTSSFVEETESDGSEYLPSEDDEPKKYVTTSNSKRKNLNKIIDDGDSTIYNERIKMWRENLSLAMKGNYKGTSSSADINYVLEGNGNIEENHEFQNGFVIPNYLWKSLYKYQKVGVKWLWELHQVQSGGLLGDEMGLGKTVQIIAFFAGLSKTDSGTWGGLGPSIIVAPATVIYQWVSHFHYWCPHLRVATLHHSGSHGGNHNKLIREVHDSHGIIMVSYAGIVKYTKDLLSRKWHYIVLDEGHKIRNPDTQVSKFVKKIPTPHRILVTGSPMQNSLQELWSLFDFMRPGLLGTYNAFMDNFAQPITQGGYANATEYQEATALEIAKALKNIITPYMLRRTKAEVQEFIKLPDKNEQVLFCALTQEQRDLYMGYLMSGTVRSILDKESRYGDPLRARVLVALCTLRKICNHPDLYLYEAQEEDEIVNEDKFGYWKRSGKLTVVHSLLKIWQKQGHRALIFSQSRAMLCILENYIQNQQYKYLKMDGTVSVSLRQGIIKTFNENSDYLIFLATTRVGGLGVNLTGADRVIIYDPDWNPATDSQAKERAWRIGQSRKVTVYRLLSAGTIEEKIYQRQIFKQFLSNKILIDPNQKNVLSTSTLQGLFTLEEPNCEGDTETASLFKHTKVNLKTEKHKKDDRKSSSKIKLEEMKKLARAISKKISKESLNNIEKNIDCRERYKKKRELLLNPPQDLPEPEINLLDNRVTNVPFESILSEIDIINQHTKIHYEENLIKDVMNQQKSVVEEEDGEIVDKIEDTPSADKKAEIIKLKKTSNHKEKKRKHSIDIDNEDPVIENLIAVKKNKRKKRKHEKMKSENDDDYVLNKLFAKSSLKNALQHDVVVGLAEKEKRYKIKEEAAKKAKLAVRAIKFSYNK